MAQGQTYPTSFSQVQIASGLNGGTAMAVAPDGRIFVTEQTGALRVVKNGTMLSTPVISLTVDSNGERGLIGIALDPAFTTNHYIYLYHTVPGTTAHNRISRYTTNGDVALAGSEVVILDLDPLSSATNHNGGGMVFGKDGKLYVGVGENANRVNAQNLNNYLGKVLRINPDGSAPADNPFPTGSASAQRIWAYGLRNPYTLAVQPGTGRIFVNDVGENSWEEINDATTGGHNFGWPDAEGMTCTGPSCATNTSYSYPVYTYAHGTGDGVGCSITGGTFFNPTTTNYPASYVGRYFFPDYCGNWINNINLSANPATRSSFATSVPGGPVGLATGTDGNLYLLSRGGLYKIIYAVPDLSPSLSLPQANFGTSGTATVGNFAMSISEVSGYSTTAGSVIVTATAPAGYTLAFPATINSINVTGGSTVAVSNNNWTVTGTVDNRQIVLKMKAGQSIGANSTVNLGFIITRTTANSGSTASITVNVTNDSTNGYDSNTTNNGYARIISGL
ncbi:PQQ-dependent sugar dehydrogenase [Spirosoma litoris]